MKQIFILLCAFGWTIMLGQTKKTETGTYIYKTTEIAYVVTELKLDSKNHTFTVKTNSNTSLRKFEERLKGQYQLLSDTIIFSFKYSNILINPMFDCKDLEEGVEHCLCTDTLIYKTGSIISKDKQFVAKRKK